MKKKVSKFIPLALFAFLAILILLVIYRDYSAPTQLKMELSQLNDDAKEKILKLDDQTELHMIGHVQLKSGEVLLTISSLERDEMFYTRRITPEQVGPFSVDITELEAGSKLRLLVEATHAVGFKLKFETNQKLTTQVSKEKPEHPDK